MTEQPPPRWQTTSRGTRDLLGAHCDGEPVEAVAADAPLLAPARAAARRSPRPRGIVAWKAVSKTATCGTSGSARARLVDRRERGRVVQRRERLELVDLAPRTSSSISDRLAEARAAVDDAVRDRVGARRPRRATSTGARLVVVDERAASGSSSRR